MAKDHPGLPEATRVALTRDLMTARRDVGAALRGRDAPALKDARARGRGHAAKLALGERGPVWWTDGSLDYNRGLAKNTPRADWFANLA